MSDEVKLRMETRASRRRKREENENFPCPPVNEDPKNTEDPSNEGPPTPPKTCNNPPKKDLEELINGDEKEPDANKVDFFSEERNLMDKHILLLLGKKKRNLARKIILIALILFVFYLFLHYGPVDSFFKREIPYKANRIIARGVLVVVFAIILFRLI